jgi:hypothetical protein
MDGRLAVETGEAIENRTLDKSGPSANARVSYPGNHKPVYPLGVPQPVAPPLADRAKKPLSYKMYKEGTDPDAHTRSFEIFLWINGETDELVVMTLFCTTLIDKVQRWADDYLNMHPSCT